MLTPIQKEEAAFEKDEWPPERIKKLRTRLGLTQRDFGQRLFDVGPNSAQSKVSALERGNYGASAATRRVLQYVEEDLEEQ